MFRPRSSQLEMINYTGGRMGVSAVPGSGKTQTLSELAANLIQGNRIGEDQEILIVTLTNSAVDNFYSRISKRLNYQDALPDFGFRVRTLHGLAHDIIRERPSLVGLSAQFQIIDEQKQDFLIKDSAFGWLRTNPEFIDQYSDSTLNQTERLKYHNQWLDLISSIAYAFIRQSKDFQIDPSAIQDMLPLRKETSLLLKAGTEIYQDYQRALNYRNAVDFDDLMMLALRALQTDKNYLERLQDRWPFILEDEAQDSSRLQEVILGLLAEKQGNWVRVGDPNQAIFETFTTANPRYLRNFLIKEDVRSVNLPQSGRSTLEIIQLANYLIDWVQSSHPNKALRSALVDPKIQPTDPGDPQPNPEKVSHGIVIHKKGLTPEEEINWVTKSILQWLPNHSDSTVAVLVPRNDRGAELADALRRNQIEPVELLRSTPSTRQAAQVLNSVLKHLVDPASSLIMSDLYETLHLLKIQQPENGDDIRIIKRFLTKIQMTENFLYPSTGINWLDSQDFKRLPAELQDEIILFRERVVRFHPAVLLPVEQLIITIAQSLFDQPADLALAHALALSIEQDARLHPEWTLGDIVKQIDEIVENKRKFVGFTEDDSGFDPEKHRGEVVITTIHKSKGLEWDRVYILSVNNYDFPSVEPHDSFISEKFFVRNNLNLEAEALSQLKAIVQNGLERSVEEGEATHSARLDYASERLRLLFVGITRAKRELRITWNTGRRGDSTPALPLIHLMEYLENANSNPS